MINCLCHWVVLAAIALFPLFGAAETLSGTFAGTILAEVNGGAAISVTLKIDGTADWNLPDGFTYYDEDSSFTYQFPSITGTSGSYTYNASTGIVTLNLNWSGSLQATNSSPMYCKLLKATGSNLKYNVITTTGAKSISGTVLVTQQYSYTGYGTWNEIASDPSFEISSTETAPTPTPTANYDLDENGSIDARDLLEMIGEMKFGDLSANSLIDFSRFWKK